MKGETILSFAIGRLRDLLVKEWLYLQALAGPVKDLHEKLTQMEELLEYAHVRQDKRTTEILKLADHLMDSIEKYVLRVVFKHIGIRERLMRPKVRLAIENVTTNINDLVNSQSVAPSNISRRVYKVQDLSGFNEKEFVGREEDINKLVSYMVDHEDEQFRVISIYGMGGLGKTTLARKLYKDKKVLSHFRSFAFVCVSEQCQAKEILKHILQQLAPEKKEEIKSMLDADVIHWLQRIQRERKCLVIVDDVWSVRDWESLNRGLPDGWTGSNVVLTTRNMDVAEKGFCYPLKCLSEDECWELLLKKIFTSRDPQVKLRMEELGRKMIVWCRGIPLAVLVLRGVLVTKYSLPEWERFYESRKWGGKEHEKFKGEVVEELLFSYKELPYPLRPCFLYLANFVEDEKIETEMLYRLWDAEGMILSRDIEPGETMIDVGERYLAELVGRSMVEAELEEAVDLSVRRRYKSCSLHDLMRELCLSIVKKENFLEVYDYRGGGDKLIVLNPSCPRNDTEIPARQAWYFTQDQEFSVHNEREAHGHVRSLMLDAGRARKLSNLKKLNYLRVLSLDLTFARKKEFINKLIHLRYLRLIWINMGKLPSSVGNLIYLQTLDIRVCTSDVIIPYLALSKLKRLRHLFLPHPDFCKVIPEFSRLRLDGLTELETLINFHSTVCEIIDVVQLTRLRRLVCMVEVRCEADGVDLKGLMNSVKLDPSQDSSLEIIVDNPKMKIYSDILSGKLPEYCEGIRLALSIIWFGGKFLSEFSSLRRLTVLRLQMFTVEEDPLPIFEKLQHLQMLKLVFGKLKGNEMTCSAMGFPRLKSLNIKYVENWEKWRIEEGSMPSLEKLVIWGCLSLVMFPDELQSITTLAYLSIKEMAEGFNRRLVGEWLEEGGELGEGGPDIYKIRHIADVAIECVDLDTMLLEETYERLSYLTDQNR